MNSRKIKEILSIIARNVFLLVNIIIFAVVALLIAFGALQAGIFLGAIVVINMGLGLGQEIHAWMVLERLQFLTALRLHRINPDGTSELVLAEELKKGDRISIKIGDQIPCDGVIVEAEGLEVNEALITGESDSLSRAGGESLLAGGIVTSGSGVMIVETIFSQSRTAQMTKTIKRYSLNVSPIQQAVNRVISICGYVLIGVIIFVVIRGNSVGQSAVDTVQNIGALASMLVPQGLVVTITVLFSYGAAYLFKKRVLLQEVNSTEKLGRIKNLCMDKTGTLTDNILSVEEMLVPEGILPERARELSIAYINGPDGESQTMLAIKKFLGSGSTSKNNGGVLFSSARKYAALKIDTGREKLILLAGSPDIFLPQIYDVAERKWLSDLIDSHSRQAKRVVCIAELQGSVIPEKITNTKLSAVAVFVLRNNLREGIAGAIDYFQKRGIIIRIISGDNVETVTAIAQTAGVRNVQSAITGGEMDAWTDAEYDTKVKKYTIFARIKPEQKERIIEAFKKDGFTAMVGDGANDALAIKKADIGIAMFDGAAATRQIASVVLMNNSFADLPQAVKLADSIIKNIEILASLFLSQTLLGFFFFIVVSVLGYSYPITVFNITFINYFTIGLTGMLIFYWAIRPRPNELIASTKPFLKTVLPFSIASALIQTVALTAVFLLPAFGIGDQHSSTLLVITSIALGFFFFLQTPAVFSRMTTEIQKKQFIFLAIVECLAVTVAFQIPIVTFFFNIPVPSMGSVLMTLVISAIAGLVQWRWAKFF